MAISLDSIVKRHEAAEPPRLLIHGVPGVGKTTFAAGAPEPIFVPLENGLGTLDVAKLPVPETFADVWSYLELLLNEQHDYKTLVIDSIDWLQTLIHDEVCRTHGLKDIEQMEYGRAYKFALPIWRSYLNMLDKLHRQGMIIINIAHTQVKRFTPPDMESFDRYQIKLADKAAALVTEWHDVILFANFIVSTKTDKRQVTRGVGTGQRTAYTTEKPAYIAKNRLGLPDQIDLSWQALVSAVGKGNE